MARVLVAWEYGEGLGHLRGVLPIARGLRERGHEVSFALRDATRLAHARDEGFASWPAPLLRPPARVDAAPLSHSDILLNLGFGDAGSVAGALRGWNAILEATRAQAVVADYAPAALLAATLRALPRATVGSGFALPPSFDPLPAIRPWESVDRDALRARDDRVRSSLRAACGASAPGLESLFHGALDLVCTWPELDPFGPRALHYVGPPATHASKDVVLAWQGDSPSRVLAYLRPQDARFGAIVEALRALGGDTIVAAPGLAAAHAATLSHGGMRVVPSTLRLEGVIEHATLCVGHAGAGFTAQAVQNGVPLAVMPLHLEQTLVARRLEALGVAVSLPIEQGAHDLAGGLRRALEASASMRERAGAIARAHAARAPLDAADRIAEWLG
jgi:UDP:flavonoid glycosyltransferase YjiC (YdhE family)